MRVILLYIVTAALAGYAWKDWFKGLCGLILMMGIMGHEDMPKSVLDIAGLNPWNFLLVSVMASWAIARKHEKLKWDMPRLPMILFSLYILLILLGWVRAAIDYHHLNDYAVRSFISEELINTLKWFIPAVMVYDGCRNHNRMVWAFCSIMGIYLLMALQLITNVPVGSLGSAGDLESGRLSASTKGFSACSMSAAMAGAAWGLLAMTPVLKKWRNKMILGAVAIAVVYALALTGGRAGYIAWVVIALAMCLLRWQKQLVLAPLLVAVIWIALPGPVERMFKGFGEQDAAGEKITDQSAVTSGRNKIWPLVIEKIGDAPVIGYGRLATIRLGITDKIKEQYVEESEGGIMHPHNIYLEWLVDNGVMGMLPVALFYGMVLTFAAILFRESNPWHSAVGGAAFAAVLTQLVSGIGGQHFYLKEDTVGMMTMAFLMLRVWVERAKAMRQRIVIPRSMIVSAPGTIAPVGEAS